MKTARIILSALVIVMAVGSAFVTKANSALIPYTSYFAPIGQTVPCTAVICDTQGTIDCVNYLLYNSYDLRVDGQCTTIALPLKRKPAIIP